MAEFVVESPGGRLDTYLATKVPESRNAVQALIRNSQIMVNGKIVTKPAYEVHAGDTIQVSRPDPVLAVGEPGIVTLEIVHESGDYIVINKPAGTVVHPSPGHDSGTLAQAVLAHAPELKSVGETGREGLVHRLDKDTSGLILFAKNQATLERLQQQFKSREVEKTYLAIVDGHPPSTKGRVEAPIARDPSNRQRFSIQDGGREAVTEFRTAKRYRANSLLEAFPLTGRTHQIRIHMKFLECPIVGDRVYGHKNLSLDVERQMLHAWKLRLPDGEEFMAPIPQDFEEAIRQAVGR